MLSRNASQALYKCNASRSFQPHQWHNFKALSLVIKPTKTCQPITSTVREASSSSSTRWKSRQGRDAFAREARVQGLKSRAAFKLLEIDEKYKIFKRGQTVVDLGYAPGSWSQVAVERTKPGGRILGIDIIPAQPPKGVSTIQGNFLSPLVQVEVKRFLSDPDRGRPIQREFASNDDETQIIDQDISYIDMEKARSTEDTTVGELSMKRKGTRKDRVDDGPEKTVDVVLSDMCAPWEQTTGFWKRSLSDPYYRMMNTTGIGFKDHNDSMNLCETALQFARDTLKTRGHFVCKFYSGQSDQEFENLLKSMFKTVHREKPKSSRQESKEAYFVALYKKREEVPKVSEAEIKREKGPGEESTDEKEPDEIGLEKKAE